MALRKFASFEVISKVLVPKNASKATLRRIAHRHHFEYEPRPGYLYVRSRAISSRCNDNFDEFPAEEIKKAYRTFVGKPVFVNHHNDNHRRARGVIIDAALHDDTNPDGTPDTWAEVLMEVDAVRFPKLAEAIVKGHIDRTSMGTDVAYSICSVCNNKATTPAEYCQHIPKMKGSRVYRTTASGKREGILVRERCYGLGFFENSLLVEEPADPTAYFLGVDTRGLGMGRGARKSAARSGNPAKRATAQKEIDKAAALTEVIKESKTAASIPISDDDREFYRQMHEDSLRQKEMYDHGQQRVVNLGDDTDLRQHLMEAHDLHEGDLWRNSHDEDHPALGPSGMDDRPLTVDEMLSLHHHDHDGEDGYPGTTMGDSHFHTAAKAPQGAPQGHQTRDPWDLKQVPKGRKTPSNAVGYEPYADEFWVKCDQGHRHYGEDGAAGALVRHTDAQGTHRYLLQQRSQSVGEPGTWSTPGGALAPGETPQEAAEHEAHEELGGLPYSTRAIHTHSDDHGGWAYHTVVMHTPHRFAPRTHNSESHGSGWFTREEMQSLPLHPHFKNSIDKVIAGAPDKVEDEPDDDFDWGRHFPLLDNNEPGWAHLFKSHGATWACSKCGKTNADGSTVCNGCGYCKDCQTDVPEEQQFAHSQQHAGTGGRSYTANSHRQRRRIAFGRQASSSAEVKARPRCSGCGTTLAPGDAGGKCMNCQDSGGGRPARQRLVQQRKHAFGEQKAPADVDTLRDEECPVCGERDSYDGNQCQVCMFVAPPPMFQDPDLEKARQLDLRKDIADEAGAIPGQQAPNNGGLPGSIPGETTPGSDEVPVDPEALNDDGVVTDEQQPVDPTMVGPNGEVVVDPSAADQHFNQGGEPFTPGPNYPQGPGGPEGPETPETLMAETGEPISPEEVGPDGQPVNLDAGDGAPGTPQDGVPDLMCPACGFSADAAQPTSINMDDPMAVPAVGDGMVAGDVCPNCQQATLITPSEAQQVQAPVRAASRAPKGWNDAHGNRRGHSAQKEKSMSRPLMEAVASQQKQIEALTRTVAVQSLQLAYVARLAGVSDHIAAIQKKADEDNPAQPIPNPPSEQAAETTEQAVTPEAYDNVQNPGMTPGSVNNLPADSTDVALAPGTSLPTAPYNQLQDVTAPVAGTETQLPLDQTRIETDVRVGDPMNPETAFPWTLSSKEQGNRTMASLHLARLQIAAGIASGDDLAVAASIEGSEQSIESIQGEIATLAKVQRVASARQQRPANLVPKAASVQRTVPSLAGDAGLATVAAAATVADDTADSDLFD